MVLVAQYKTQYLLTVSSDHGSPSGGDWYDEGKTAHATLDTGLVSDNLFYDWVFTGWQGDASGSNLQSNPITMDGPKTATATWNHEFSMIFYAIVAVVVVAAAAVAGIMLMRRGKGPKTQRVAAPQATYLSGQQKFCPNCHAVLPVEAAICSACGKPT
jgi:uncharacterized repeat protein (TIGR02543 family)